MKEIFDFEFKTPSKDNAPEYRMIRAGNRNGKIDPITYHIIPKEKGELMSGEGILTMQKRIATVFKVFKPELYKQYFKLNLSDPIKPGNEKLFEAVTDGRYTIRTMQLVMDFQKIYMSKFRNENNQVPTLGFGSFGGYTKHTLDDWWGAALRKIKGNSTKHDYLLKQ